LPPKFCDIGTENCAELIHFEPQNGLGYVDINTTSMDGKYGESQYANYRSWLRRDFVYLVKYATAKVALIAKDWDTGNGVAWSSST